MSKDGFRLSCTGSAFFSILTIIFVIGKVFGFINWSWWLVFLPTIIGVGITLLIMLVIVIGIILFSRKF